MKHSPNRRKFIKVLSTTSVLTSLAIPTILKSSNTKNKYFSHKIKLSLNVYSFNKPLRDGEIDLFDVLDFCAEHNFDAIDPTGYYFPNYPQVPSDNYINEFKRKAFLLGLDISGTGVRNDFANPDQERRAEDIELIRQWTEVAAKLGAPVLRIFPGHHDHKGFNRSEVFEWMAEDINRCCEIGEMHGVLMALQNHNGFLKTAEDVNRLFGRVNSDWLGQNLDIGSYRQNPPYEEIKKNIDHAVTWQIKENVWINDQETPVDLVRLFKIIQEAGYRGYLPLETLGEGDPFEKIPVLLEKVNKALKRL